MQMQKGFAAHTDELLERLYDRRLKHQPPRPRSSDDITGDLEALGNTCEMAKDSMMRAAKDYLKDFETLAPLDEKDLDASIEDALNDAVYEMRKALKQELDEAPPDEIPGQSEWAASRGV